jgi:hypothetical protein
MIADHEIDAMKHEERCAWLDSLNADEEAIVYTPVGYRSTMAVVAWIKHGLMTEEMSANARLELLEGLAGLVDGAFSPAALAAIQPAGDVDAQMIRETFAVDDIGKTFDLLGSVEVFSHLAQLNPSLLEAIRICWPDRAP